jgi:anti-sigma factor RsiW
MTCALPPPLDDAQLLAFGDDGIDDNVREHLRRCPHCRARAARLSRLNRFLAASLHRLDCPPSIELGEHHLGLLPPERAQVIQAHLAACPHCARELHELQGYLADLAPELQPSLLEGVKVLVARLVSGPAPGAAAPAAMRPALAGLRGEAGGMATYQADGLQITLEAQPDPHSPGRHVLLGMLAGAEGPGWNVRLLRDGQVAHTAPVDELGNFRLADLAAGRWEVVLAGPELEIRLPVLEL